MPKYKKQSLVGLSLVSVSILAIYINLKLFGCSGSFDTFQTLLSYVDLLITIFVLASFLFIPVGLILLYRGYVIWRRERNFSRISIFFELIGVTIVLGLIVSIFLAQFNSARNKGPNAAVMSSVNNVRAQAELYLDINNSYEGVCIDSEGVVQIIRSLKENIYNRGLLCSRIPPEVECSTEEKSFAVSAKLPHQDAGNYYCVDSTGFAGVTETPVGETKCPK